MVCEVADRYVEALVVLGRVDEAIDGLNQRLAMDPACEPAHARLMQLFAGMGRRTDALRQYQACAAALQRDLGAEPGAETRSLYQALRDTERDVIAPYESRGTATASTGPDRPTVAVLPFDNLASAKDDYFVDGIVEDIITALSCFHSLLVIARGSSFHYRDGKVPDRQVAEELGAQFLVRGSVRRADDRVRIKVQLLDAVAGLNLWGHRYDRKIEDVFQLQDEITSTLVSTLAGKVEEARLAVARKAPPERLDAYDILLKGKDHHHRFSAKDCRACIDLFEQAIERDPSYALAHAWLACGLGQAMVFELDDPARLVDRSQAAAERGLVLDENDAESHRVLAQIFLTRRDLKRSIRHQERALFLNPNDDESVCSMGEILSFIGRHDEAEEWVRKSMRLNPYHPERYWTHLTRPLIHLGRYAEALDALEHIGRLRMDDHGYRVAASALLGDQQLLGQNLLELQTAFPEFEPDAFVASLPYDRENDRKELRDALLSGFEQKDAVSE
jgi:adenylate cyclase